MYCNSKFNYICIPKERQDNLQKKNHSFCLKVYKLELKSDSLQADSDYYLVRASLFDFNFKRFVGKQWNSTKITNYKTIDNMIYFEFNETIYFHTSLIGESLVLIFELIQCNSVDIETVLGWGIFNLFKLENNPVDISSDQQSQDIQIQILKGSPRALLLMDNMTEAYPDSQKHEGAFIHIIFNINQSFNSCQHLVPENLLLHENDSVPGLKTTKDGRINFTRPILNKCSDFTIENLDILIGPSLFDFENNFKKLLNSDRATGDGNSLNKGSELWKIVERRVKVGVYNGYTFIEHHETVSLNVRDSKAKSSKPSLSSTSDKDHNNKLTAKNPIAISLPIDRNFSVIFFLEYVLEYSTPEDSSRPPGSSVSSSQHTYQIGWAAYQPFDGEIEMHSFKDGCQIEIILCGGSANAPTDALVYRSETFKNTVPASGEGSVDYQGSDLKLTAVFRTKITDAPTEPIITLQSTQLQFSQRPPTSEIPDAQKSSPISDASSPKDPPPIPIKPRQRRISKPPESMSSLLLGTTSSPTMDTLGEYADIEPYVVVQDCSPSARGLSQSMVPLQMPSRSCIGLSRSACRNIIAAGFQDFVDSDGNIPLIVEPSDFVESINWSLEENDDRDCDEIIFQFLALSRYDSNGIGIQTESIFITLQFYRFPQISTEKLKLDGVIENISNHIMSSPMVLKKITKADWPGTTVKYLLNTSESMDPRERFSFLKYLSQQILYVNVWDGDSLMLLGCCGVPLKNICRQGKPSVQVTYELDIINQTEIEEASTSSIKGRLHLRMINLGSTSGRKKIKTPLSTFWKKDFLIDATNVGRPADTSNKVHNRSVVVVRPRHVASKHRELAQSYGSESLNSTKTPLMNDDVLRGMNSEKVKKLLRLKGLMESLSISVDKSETLQHSGTIATISELDVIESFRAQHKMTNIRQLLGSVVQKEMTIYPKFGSTEMFEIKLKNHCNYETAVEIQIMDDSNCLSLVRNPFELRALKYLYSITTPTEDDLITTNKQKGCPEIFMRPKETVLVPFKYVDMTFNPYQTVREPSCIEGAATKQSNSLSERDYLKQVMFVSSDGTLLTVLRIQVCPQPLTIDQTFRFFHPEQTYLKKIIRLPPLCVMATPYDTIRVLTRCSDPAVMTDCPLVPLGTPHDVFLRVNCWPHPQIRQFLVATYVDQFMLQPIQVWHFVVHSEKRLDVVANQGQVSHFSIPLQGCSGSHGARVYSSHPNELSTDAMTSSDNNELKMSLTPLRIGNRMFHVNVVDPDTSKLIAAWSINAICKEPVVSKVFDLEIPVNGGEMCKKKVSFQNPYGLKKKFFIITDRQDLIMFKNTILQIEPNNKDYIGIIFLPTTRRGQQKINVFINDDNGKNEEAFSMLVNYV